jgi:rhodanese-related sulfurtransferase
LLSLDQPLSGAIGVLMAVAAHAVGWPIPRGGSQSLTNALCRYLATFGSMVRTSSRVESLAALSNYDLILCDLTPRQLLNIAGERLSKHFRRELQKYRYGPGVFKVDYALSAPIPWKASDCSRAATVHLGGSFEEIAVSEKGMRNRQHADCPFVLLVQPSLFDPSRAPASKHTAWAYCHVPNGSNMDMLRRLEDQIERFAPGFRECVLARRVFSPADLESMDANLVGGDIAGGAMDLRQFLFRPTWRHYATSAREIYICSSSTPPGGGVHGMCGYHAAKMALARLKIGRASSRGTQIQWSSESSSFPDISLIATLCGSAGDPNGTIIWVCRRKLIMANAPKITPDELKSRMEAGEDFTIIDVRNPNAWAQSDAIIPGAIRFTLDKLEESLPRIPKNKPVVAYCTWPNEGSSASLVQKLQERGYKDVWALQGGFDAWRNAGMPVQSKQAAA